MSRLVIGIVSLLLAGCAAFFAFYQWPATKEISYEWPSWVVEKQVKSFMYRTEDGKSRVGQITIDTPKAVFEQKTIRLVPTVRDIVGACLLVGLAIAFLVNLGFQMVLHYRDKWSGARNTAAARENANNFNQQMWLVAGAVGILITGATSNDSNELQIMRLELEAIRGAILHVAATPPQSNGRAIYPPEPQAPPIVPADPPNLPDLPEPTDAPSLMQSLPFPAPRQERATPN
ncbi:MAG TPA: hypothetical protein VGN12_28105 [Pirellulales bacterium]|jgi:hypothetical protein